ncbi:MAG: capsule biosynthesis protein [Paracoccaceae bacterium]
MKPRAAKYRIRKPETAAAEAGARQPAQATAAATVPAAPEPAPSVDAQIDAIRREGLTGRQLRMARRVAQRHGLAAVSDHDAVRVLRDAGIDPFQRAAVLELVSDRPDVAAQPQLPQIARQAPPPAHPQPHADPEAPAEAIMAIQRDIARRRRRKLIALGTRLAFFVLLPTLLTAIYYFRFATPFYATKTEFVIQQAQPAGGAGGGLGGLFSGTSFATSQDSIAVQGYLQSRDAMVRLDGDLGYRAHFSDPRIDAIQRLAPGATNETAYKHYNKHVKIAYDPTEGIIKMEVAAADPHLSEAFSRALISYAEEQVDHLTQRLREDQMKGARESYESAEVKMLEAQRNLVDLQERSRVLSSEVEVGLITGQISALEAQLTQANLSLQEMLANRSPNQARVEPLKRRIATLETEIGNLRAKLTQSDENGQSLAKIQGDLLVAHADVQTRQMMLTQALQQLETARIEANRQVRYLSLSVSPVAPDEATYPRALENTMVAFLIFGGLYLMLSMTASILREQVSA